MLQHDLEADGSRHRQDDADDSEQHRADDKREDDHDRTQPRRLAERNRADEVVDRQAQENDLAPR